MSNASRNPYLVLAAALVLPGSGHVLLGLAPRGLMFLFFIIVLGWAGSHVMPEGASFFARHIGGIFVYGLSVIDAYRTARIRRETGKYAEKNKTG
jgi:hypothetical protein